MPDLCSELHDGRLERIVVRDLDVDVVGGTMVGSIGRATKDAFEVCQVIESVGAGLGLVQRLERDARVGILLNVLNLLDQAAVSVRRHDYEICRLVAQGGSAWSRVGSV